MTTPHPLFAAPRQAPWLEPYWTALGQGELHLPRCSKCGRWEWYPIEAGPACDGAHYQWENVGPTAEVFTITHVQRPLLPDVKEAYFTGLVVTERAPDCRIPAFFDQSEGTISIGDRVTLRVSHEHGAPFPYFVKEVRP